MTDDAKVTRHDGTSSIVRVSSKVFGLDLGNLRALVAAAEGLPDGASVYFEGLSKSYVRLDEFSAKQAVVRHEDFS